MADRTPGQLKAATLEADVLVYIEVAHERSTTFGGFSTLRLKTLITHDIYIGRYLGKLDIFIYT